MAEVILNLTNEATEEFAAYHGWGPKVGSVDKDGNDQVIDNPQSAEDFAAQILISQVQNDVMQKRTDDAAATAQEQPLPDVTVN